MRLLARKGTVWIFCPAGLVSGGPEALHQLSFALLQKGIDARVVYYPETGCVYPVPERYKVYKPAAAACAEDREDDVVVVPESFTGRLRSFKKARRVIWWLSVDNYLKWRTVGKIIKSTLRGRGSLRISGMAGVHHLCQSYYAKKYLEARGIRNAAMLTDYLRDEFFSEHVSQRKREDLVLYYPKKGREFTEQLMASYSGPGRWAPLKDMEPRQVVALMRRAKLYVDFGHHPGRDRIPREAAIAGCCILTGRKGSAGNEIDVPIPQFYKVDESLPSAVDDAIGKVRGILECYDAHRVKFTGYRDWIVGQKRQFLNEVESLFS